MALPPRGKVIVEIDGVQHVVAEGFVDMIQEVGYRQIESSDLAEGVHFEENGRRRTQVRCWVGSLSYDDFQSEV